MGGARTGVTDGFEALDPWVRAEHLGSEQVSPAPAPCRSIDGFLMRRVSDELAGYLAGGAVWGTAYRLFSDPHQVSPERWGAVSDADRLSKTRVVVGPGDEPSSPGAVRYVRLLHLMRSAAFRSLIARVGGTGLRPIHELTTWSLVDDDFVRPHRYDPATCGLRASLCLSTGWRPALGGGWCVSDDQERLIRVPFRHNTLLVLDVSSGATHWAAPSRDATSDLARITVSACFGRAR